MDKRENFRIKLKNRREQLGLSLRELGEICGVSASFLSAVERGENFPSMKKLSQIAEGLKVSIGWLLGEEDLDESEDVITQTLEKNGMVYELFLDKHVFPNGLTYEQMCDKIDLLEKFQKMLNNDVDSKNNK